MDNKWSAFHNTYEANAKGLLQEVLNAADVGFNQNDISYALGRNAAGDDTTGPNWLCRLTIGKSVAVRARGRSKKDASVRAARLALDNWAQIYKKLANQTTAAMCEILEALDDPISPRTQHAEAITEHGGGSREVEPKSAAAFYADTDDDAASSDLEDYKRGMVGLSDDDDEDDQPFIYIASDDDVEGEEEDDEDMQTDSEEDATTAAALFEYAGRLFLQGLVMAQQGHAMDQRSKQKREQPAPPPERRSAAPPKRPRKRIVIPTGRGEAGRARQRSGGVPHSNRARRFPRVRDSQELAAQRSLRERIVELCDGKRM